MQHIDELFTLRDLLRFATSEFNQAELYFGHGTDNAWDEAAALIMHALHLPHSIFREVMDARLTKNEREKIFALIKRRVEQRVPLSYLTNEAWFAGLTFYVDERVLIPRSPIAELIENEFQPWIGDKLVTEILDLCTGSACIAIVCAKAFPDANVDASDISADALAVAKINLEKYSATEQINLIQSDLFENIPAKKYDIIVSNPPYVDQIDMDELPQEYLHEPRLALAAGDDGLDIVKKILKNAANWLTPNGILVVETGNSEAAMIEQFPEIPFNWLEFERGGGGVFLLTKTDLDALRLP